MKFFRAPWGSHPVDFNNDEAKLCKSLAIASCRGEVAAADAARLLALELFREDKISLGRAGELSETPVEAFMEFAGQRQVPLHYGALDLEGDRQTMQRFQK